MCVPLDGSDRLSSPSVSRNVSFMSAKSSTSSAPGDAHRTDDRTTPATPHSGGGGGGLSRAKSVKRSGVAVASAAKNQPLQLRTATVLTAGRGYVLLRSGHGGGRPLENDSGNGHLDACLVVWNQKLQ